MVPTGFRTIQVKLAESDTFTVKFQEVAESWRPSLYQLTSMGGDPEQIKLNWEKVNQNYFSLDVMKINTHSLNSQTVPSWLKIVLCGIHFWRTIYFYTFVDLYVNFVIIWLCLETILLQTITFMKYIE